MQILYEQSFSLDNKLRLKYTNKCHPNAYPTVDAINIHKLKCVNSLYLLNAQKWLGAWLEPHTDTKMKTR